ncbi:unnamed protein product [Brassica oleracea]
MKQISGREPITLIMYYVFLSLAPSISLFPLSLTL